MGNQHVQIPNGTLENTSSERNSTDKKYYVDLLVYAILKLYMVAESGISLVSMRKVAEETKISLGGVQASIQRLIDSKDIEKIKISGRNQNGYKFNKTSEKFEMFDKQFLQNTEITNAQKGFMIVMQKHLFIDKELGIGKTTYSSKELSEHTGLSERVINERRNELESLGFVTRRLTTDKHGNSCEALEFNLPKFGQYVLCTLEKHEEDILELKAKYAQSTMEMNKLKSMMKLVMPNIVDITDGEIITDTTFTI